MTEVNVNRSANRPTSSEMMEEALELSHAVKDGEGRILEWRANHETAPEGTRRDHDAPTSKETLKEALHLTEKAYDGYERMSKAIGLTATVAVMEVAVPVAIGAATVGMVVHAFATGDELKELRALDLVDLGTTALLRLDEGFKAADMTKHGAVGMTKNGDVNAQKLIEYMNKSEYGKAHLPALQAEADQGARAAFTALRCPGGRGEYLKMHPADAAKLANNVAFNKGFECVMWCAGRPDGESRLKALQQGLDERDARAKVTTTTIRG